MLGVDVVTSAIGGIFGAVVLMIAAPLLAEVALQFTSFEYFWLAALGLSATVMIASTKPAKAGLAVLLGLLLSTVGVDITLGFPRFTFGNTELLNGVNFIPAMIGLFGVAEVLRNYGSSPPADPITVKAENIFSGVAQTLWRYKGNMVRSGIIGVIVGILPGAGADIAAWIAYAVAPALEGAGEVRQRPHRADRGRRHGQQRLPGGRLGAGAGLRHPRRLDHRHRHRRPVHEGAAARGR